jgi:hypothetical protein
LVTFVGALIVRPRLSRDVFPFLLAISILTVGGILYLNNVLGMLYEGVAYTGAVGSWFGSGGIGGFIAKFIFIQLSPFPWYQGGPSSLLVYQVFDYGQTLLGLTVMTALVIGWRTIWFEHGHESRTLVVVGLFLMLCAIVGSALHQRYAQIVLPLVILASAPVLQRRWPMCLFVSSLIIVFAHLAFGILK